jgi:hypothetical protein
MNNHCRRCRRVRPGARLERWIVCPRSRTGPRPLQLGAPHDDTVFSLRSHVREMAAEPSRDQLEAILVRARRAARRRRLRDAVVVTVLVGAVAVLGFSLGAAV